MNYPFSPDITTDTERRMMPYESRHHPLPHDRGHLPGNNGFIVTKEGKGAFAETGPVEIVGFVTCGGCPGKRAIPRAQMLLTKGEGAALQ
ncbi:MAG: hypothetical protein APR53_08105 [Methanoculleus sp. SDB]|nr:MAG: hypothetical protein APR53_08105 [Methanoculleus sp. SDB]